MAIFLNTLQEGTFTINDLGGIVLTHPVTNLDLEIEYSPEKISRSKDLKNLLDSGVVELRDEDGNLIDFERLGDSQGFLDLVDFFPDFQKQLTTAKDLGKIPFWDSGEKVFKTSDLVKYGTLIIDCIKDSPGTISAGRPVKITGSQNGIFKIENTNGNTECIGLTAENITDTVAGKVIVFGLLENIDTGLISNGETWNAGDDLFVNGNNLTNVKPSGTAQRIGKVLEPGTPGKILVHHIAYETSGGGLPSLPSERFWFGDASNQPQPLTINDFTEKTSVSHGSDYLLAWDAAAQKHKKVKIFNTGGISAFKNGIQVTPSGLLDQKINFIEGNKIKLNVYRTTPGQLNVEIKDATETFIEANTSSRFDNIFSVPLLNDSIYIFKIYITGVDNGGNWATGERNIVVETVGNTATIRIITAETDANNGGTINSTSFVFYTSGLNLICRSNYNLPVYWQCHYSYLKHSRNYGAIQ